jgi:phosphate starvation-inducible PhoH-like protein
MKNEQKMEKAVTEKAASSGVPEQVTMTFDDNDLARSLFGPQGDHLKSIETYLGLHIKSKGNELVISGDKGHVEIAKKVLSQLYHFLIKGYPITGRDIERSVRLLKADAQTDIGSLYLDSIFIPGRKRVIYPQTLGQKHYLEAILSNEMVFGIGPAGTGKTYLAMAMAVRAYLKGEVERIVLTRPAIEAGEKLGFLPANLVEKVNPYLRPLYDAMHDMLDFDKTQKMLERGEIEVAPLAFMRGRTLSEAFVILDEAQNCTREQMKMFLTRIGFGSRCVITGDVTQVDLPSERRSGLRHAMGVLKNIPGISFHYLSSKDVVRHPLVQKIVDAYEAEQQEEDKAP